MFFSPNSDVAHNVKPWPRPLLCHFCKMCMKQRSLSHLLLTVILCVSFLNTPDTSPPNYNLPVLYTCGDIHIVPVENKLWSSSRYFVSGHRHHQMRHGVSSYNFYLPHQHANVAYQISDGQTIWGIAVGGIVLFVLNVDACARVVCRLKVVLGIISAMELLWEPQHNAIMLMRALSGIFIVSIARCLWLQNWANRILCPGVGSLLDYSTLRKNKY